MARKSAKCGRYNHYQTMCNSNQKVHQVESDESDEEYDDDDDYESVPYITTNETTEFVYSLGASKDINAKMIVNKRPVVFQIDHGASINILARKYLHNEGIQSTANKLRVWNGSVLNPVRETTMKVKNEKTD